jgi:hypothetical protein
LLQLAFDRSGVVQRIIQTVAAKVVNNFVDRSSNGESKIIMAQE